MTDQGPVLPKSVLVGDPQTATSPQSPTPSKTMISWEPNNRTLLPVNVLVPKISAAGDSQKQWLESRGPPFLLLRGAVILFIMTTDVVISVTSYRDLPYISTLPEDGGGVN